MHATTARSLTPAETDSTQSAPAARHDLPPTPQRPRMRAFEVPTPRSADEARAAIALAERTLTGIEGTRPEVEASGDRDKLHRVNTARSAWEQKKVELEMLLVRFERGETYESMELAAARERVCELEQRNRDAQELAIRERMMASKTIAELSRAVEARGAEIEALKARLDASGAGFYSDEATGTRPGGAVAVFHDFCALSLEVLDEMDRTGAPLTLLARALRHRAASRVARSYVDRWRAQELPLVVRFAEVREEREAREATARVA